MSSSHGICFEKESAIRELRTRDGELLQAPNPHQVTGRTVRTARRATGISNSGLAMSGRVRRVVNIICSQTPGTASTTTRDGLFHLQLQPIARPRGAACPHLLLQFSAAPKDLSVNGSYSIDRQGDRRCRTEMGTPHPPHLGGRT